MLDYVLQLLWSRVHFKAEWLLCLEYNISFKTKIIILFLTRKKMCFYMILIVDFHHLSDIAAKTFCSRNIHQVFNYIKNRLICDKLSDKSQGHDFYPPTQSLKTNKTAIFRATLQPWPTWPNNAEIRAVIGSRYDDCY